LKLFGQKLCPIYCDTAVTSITAKAKPMINIYTKSKAEEPMFSPFYVHMTKITTNDTTKGVHSCIL